MSSFDSDGPEVVSQQEVLRFVRQMRALLNNMRVYPEGHRLIGEATVRLWNLMQNIVERSTDGGATFALAPTTAIDEPSLPAGCLDCGNAQQV